MSTVTPDLETPLQKAIRLAGGQAPLAEGISRVIGRRVTQQAVSWWMTKRGHEVPSEYCRAIEQLLDGAVTREQLRPDLFADRPPSAPRADQQQAA